MARGGPVYVSGLYRKLSRGVSQSPWIIDDEVHGDGSVADIIAARLRPLVGGGGSVKLLSAGREVRRLSKYK